MLQNTHIRRFFPVLRQKVYGKDLVYFDNAASTQKPEKVIAHIAGFYRESYANVHRGVHFLSQEATEQYEATRRKTQVFFNAKHTHEIIFTRGTTEGINLIANGFSQLLKAKDEVIISAMEHHSNIVPWQMACDKSGAVLKIIPINQRGELDLDAFDKLLSPKTRLLAVSHVSNTLGTVNPVKKIIAKAHAFNAAVLIDGAQATAHFQVDVQDLDCDFYVTSAHKMYGPTGVGVLYGKELWLNRLPVYQGGGEMIRAVTFEKTTYAGLPFKFEAGTPNIAGVTGFGAALDFLSEFPFDEIAAYENELLQYATEQIRQIPGIECIGTAADKASVLSFVVKNTHPADIGMILDKQGIALRTGAHCTQPLMAFYKIPGTIRASFAFYNNFKEIDSFIQALQKAVKMLNP